MCRTTLFINIIINKNKIIIEIASYNDNLYIVHYGKKSPHRGSGYRTI